MRIALEILATLFLIFGFPYLTALVTVGICGVMGAPVGDVAFLMPILAGMIGVAAAPAIWIFRP